MIPGLHGYLEMRSPPALSAGKRPMHTLKSANVASKANDGGVKSKAACIQSRAG
jgi:hypothetical protein